MARYTGARAKIVRKFGINIFGNPKFDKVLKKRPFPPGQHGRLNANRKLSEYGLQLMEKQKAKYFYGISERQFRNYFDKATRMGGNTGDNLIELIERRFDVMVYRAGFAPTLAAARQLISHGHLLLNGKKVNIPSVLLKENDVFEIKPKTKEKNLDIIVNTLKDRKEFPSWLEVNKATQTAKVIGKPIREEAVSWLNVSLIVELYSK